MCWIVTYVDFKRHKSNITTIRVGAGLSLCSNEKCCNKNVNAIAICNQQMSADIGSHTSTQF